MFTQFGVINILLVFCMLLGFVLSIFANLALLMDIHNKKIAGAYRAGPWFFVIVSIVDILYIIFFYYWFISLPRG